MNRKTRPCLCLGAGLLLAASGAWVVRAQQKGNANFTGTITRLESPKGAIAHIHFDAGARTKWHIHEGGQVILVEEGVGLAQVKGGPVIELHAGQSLYCPPGVPHWHGAAPHEGGTQLNLTMGGIQWLNEVTEKEYTAKPQQIKIPR